MPPPSTISATGCFALACAFSCWMRVALSAAGGCSTNCDNSMALPVQAVSHSKATLVSTTNQPSPRRGSIRRAPTSSNTSSGTGGSSNAVRNGFQDSICSRARRLFTAGRRRWRTRDCA